MSGGFDPLPELRTLQLEMLAGIRRQLLSFGAGEAAEIAMVQGGDVIYRIDTRGEEILVEWCERWTAAQPFLLVAEGVTETGERMFPADAPRESARWVVIVDPIDGTRGLMYNKRSAWILAGVAPFRGASTTLADVRWAVMTEIPTTRAYLADQLWAERDRGAQGVTLNLLHDPPAAVGRAVLSPSRASDLRHGFASIVKYFPGGKELTARLEEALFEALLGPPDAGIPQVFDDEYVSSGGQLAEMIAGRDRFIADLRPVIYPLACPDEPQSRLTAHPYDLCTEMIAREAGVVVTGLYGGPLRTPLDVHTPVAWIAYANPVLHAAIEPVLQRLLREMGVGIA